jgi:hypothetical protein
MAKSWIGHGNGEWGGQDMYRAKGGTREMQTDYELENLEEKTTWDDMSGGKDNIKMCSCK